MLVGGFANVVLLLCWCVDEFCFWRWLVCLCSLFVCFDVDFICFSSLKLFFCFVNVVCCIDLDSWFCGLLMVSNCLCLGCWIWLIICFDLGGFGFVCLSLWFIVIGLWFSVRFCLSVVLFVCFVLLFVCLGLLLSLLFWFWVFVCWYNSVAWFALWL